jgi:hypothetical protein
MASLLRALRGPGGAGVEAHPGGLPDVRLLPGLCLRPLLEERGGCLPRLWRSCRFPTGRTAGARAWLASHPSSSEPSRAYRGRVRGGRRPGSDAGVGDLARSERWRRKCSRNTSRAERQRSGPGGTTASDAFARGWGQPRHRATHTRGAWHSARRPRRCRTTHGWTGQPDERAPGRSHGTATRGRTNADPNTNLNSVRDDHGDARTDSFAVDGHTGTTRTEPEPDAHLPVTHRYGNPDTDPCLPDRSGPRRPDRRSRPSRVAGRRVQRRIHTRIRRE